MIAYRMCTISYLVVLEDKHVVKQETLKQLIKGY